MSPIPKVTDPALERERAEVLEQLDELVEPPMLALGFVWLVLLVVELVWGLSPLLTAAGTVIWVLFVLEFALEFVLAPRKRAYLARNWLTALSLLLPALRVFRVARVARLLRGARAVRGLRLVRFVTSLNRGIRSLRASLGRRGFGYIVALTSLVTLAGAGGMYAFEHGDPEQGGAGGFGSYGEAVWWTAMLLTSIGSEYWPQTAEGRVLCVLLSVYGFAVFGYVTATLASYFVGRDAEDERAEVAGAGSVEALRAEVAALHAELRLWREEGARGRDR